MAKCGNNLNDRQRRFCQLVAEGVKVGEAYEGAGYKLRGEAARVEGMKTLRKPYVSEYLEQLRKKTEATAEITREEFVADLVSMWRSKPEEAAMDNPLCELKMTKAGPVAMFPDKSFVGQRLAKMLGWDEPEKHEVNITDSEQVIKDLMFGGSQ